MKTPFLMIASLVACLLLCGPASAQGLVTVNGGGHVLMQSSSLTGSHLRTFAQAGGFPTMTDVEIMERAQMPEVLLLDWVPFTPLVPVGCQEFCPLIYPPSLYEPFEFATTATLSGDTVALAGHPVYVVVFNLEEFGERARLVVHKTTGIFPANGGSATITVEVDGSAPRLLAGSVVGSGVPAGTLSPQPSARTYENWSFAWSVGAPTDDDDGDAHPNEEEWMAGTDPRDAASRLELQWKAVSGNAIDLEWPARPGGRYTILQADHPGLQKPVTMPGDVIMGTAPRMTRTIQVPAGTTRRFFAVFCW